MARRKPGGDLLGPPPVEGLAYQAGLLAPAEERALVPRLAALDLVPFQFQRWQGKRRVAWFGWRYDYDEAALLPAPPMPDFLLDLRARAARLAELPADALVQVLVTEYAPGAGIGWHRDRPSFERVVGVSLLSACTLRLRRRVEGRFERHGLFLEPGSAYLLSGAVRTEWEHSIAPVEQLRYSVTFRSLRAAADPPLSS